MAFQLADLFEIVAAEVPDRVALIAGDMRVTYRELDEQTNRFASALDTLGVGVGDPIGIYATNCGELVIAMIGAWKRRSVPVVVNARASARELDEIASDAAFAALVCDDAHAATVAASEARARLGDDHLMVIDRGVALEGAHDFATLLQRADASQRFTPRSNDDHYVLYTGGTTGRPKGVVWRHEDIFQSATAGGNPGGPAITEPEQLAEVVTVNKASRIGPFLPPGDPGPDQFVSLSLGPLSHASGQWGMFGTLLAGGTLVLYTRASVDMAYVLELVTREHITMLTLVGDASARPLLDELDAQPDRYDTSSLRLFGSGGTILTASVKRRLLDVVPTALAVLEAVGASESPSQAVAVLTRDGQTGSSLTFNLKAESMIVDDNLKPVGVGVVGRLATSGPVPIGYHNDPERSASTFVQIDGKRWSIPGDLAYVGEDAMLHLVGRGSLCINTGGEKVYPEEVEAVLKTHPFVRDAAIVGAAEPRWGQLVTAVVTVDGRARQPADLLDDLRAHCRSALAAYKAPRAVVLVDALARTSAGKLDYPWAREQAAGVTDGEVRDAR
ncbi:MAG TPA: AMP-binding protein [Acidimicrobiia bacterium]